LIVDYYKMTNTQHLLIFKYLIYFFRIERKKMSLKKITPFSILVIIIVVLVGIAGYLYGENTAIKGQTTTISYTATATSTTTSTTTSTSISTSTLTSTTTSTTTATSTATLTATITATTTSISTITQSQNYTTTLSFTQTYTFIPENFEITDSFITRNLSDYTITIGYKNTGYTEIFITEILVSDEPLNTFWSTSMVNGSNNPIIIKMGTSGVILVTFPDKGDAKAFVSGQIIEIKIKTPSGTYYVGTFSIP